MKLKIMLGSTPVVVMVDAKDEDASKLGVGWELIAGVVQKSFVGCACPKDAWRFACGGAAARLGVCHCGKPGLIGCAGPNASCCELIMASFAYEKEGLWASQEKRWFGIAGAVAGPLGN